MTDSLDYRPQCSVPGCTNQSAFANGKDSPSYPHYRRDTWILAKYPELTECFCCSRCHGKHISTRAGVKNQAELTKLNTLAANAKGYSSIKQMEYCEALDAAILHGVSEEEFVNANTLTRNAMANGYDTALGYTNALLMESTIAAGYTRIADYRNSTHSYRYLLNFIDYCENIDARFGWRCAVEDQSQLVAGQFQVDHIDSDHGNDDRDNMHVLCSNCHDRKSQEFMDYLAWDKKPAHLYPRLKEVRKINRECIAARGVMVDKKKVDR